jgi:RHS repeat-associated protein
MINQFELNIYHFTVTLRGSKTGYTAFDTRFKFTGKEKDEETGYSYFGARYYDSDLSVWLSVDPMSDKRLSTSPFAYCQNNPIVLVDPTGMLDGWFEGKDNQAHFDPTVNSQQDMTDKGIGGKYIGAIGGEAGKDGNQYNLNADGTKTQHDVAEISANRNPASAGNHTTSKAGLDFITRQEGCVLNTYKDAAGLPTIGVGHLIKQGEHFSKITQTQAMQLLKNDVKNAGNAVNSLVKVPITQYQFDALVSFTFNVGNGNFKSSSVLKNVNAGNFSLIPVSLQKWNKAKVNGVLTPVPGLTTRRKEESDLFLNGQY